MALKKTGKKESAAPVMDIPVALVKVSEGELHEEPRTITTESGNTFTVDPGFNCRIEIVDDFGSGEHDGKTFYENFKLKPSEDEEGEWELRDGTKFAALCKARYGNDFFESDAEFDPDDLEGFVFQAKVQPKKHMQTKQVIGSTLHYETIMAPPKPKKKGESKTPKQEEAAELNEVDFNDLPF